MLTISIEMLIMLIIYQFTSISFEYKLCRILYYPDNSVLDV